MKRVLLGVVLALVGSSVHAEVSTPLKFYNEKIAGMWAGRDGDVNLVYSVRPDSIRVEGESCVVSAHGSQQNCLPIDQRYLVSETQVLRDDQKFGVRPVEIKVGENEVVRREFNPVMKDRVAITSEKVSADGHTLIYTIDVEENGRLIYHKQFELERVNGPGAFAGL